MPRRPGLSGPISPQATPRPARLEPWGVSFHRPELAIDDDSGSSSRAAAMLFAPSCHHHLLANRLTTKTSPTTRAIKSTISVGPIGIAPPSSAPPRDDDAPAG